MPKTENHQGESGARDRKGNGEVKPSAISVENTRDFLLFLENAHSEKVVKYLVDIDNVRSALRGDFEGNLTLVSSQKRVPAPRGDDVPEAKKAKTVSVAVVDAWISKDPAAVYVRNAISLSGILKKYSEAYEKRGALITVQLPHLATQTMASLTVADFPFYVYRLFRWHGIYGPLNGNEVRYVSGALDVASGDAYTKPFKDYIDKIYTFVENKSHAITTVAALACARMLVRLSYRNLVNNDQVNSDFVHRLKMLYKSIPNYPEMDEDVCTGLATRVRKCLRKADETAVTEGAKKSETTAQALENTAL